MNNMMFRKFFKLFIHCTVPSVETTWKTASGHEYSSENPNIKRDIWTNKVKYVAGRRFKIHIIQRLCCLACLHHLKSSSIFPWFFNHFNHFPCNIAVLINRQKLIGFKLDHAEPLNKNLSVRRVRPLQKFWYLFLHACYTCLLERTFGCSCNGLVLVMYLIKVTLSHKPSLSIGNAKQMTKV
jgi:hypothetical protein